VALTLLLLLSGHWAEPPAFAGSIRMMRCTLRLFLVTIVPLAILLRTVAWCIHVLGRVAASIAFPLAPMLAPSAVSVSQRLFDPSASNIMAQVLRRLTLWFLPFSGTILVNVGL
jgi:hypothetical protein